MILVLSGGWIGLIVFAGQSSVWISEQLILLQGEQPSWWGTPLSSLVVVGLAALPLVLLRSLSRDRDIHAVAASWRARLAA